MNGSAQFLMSHGGAVLFTFVFIEEGGLPVPAAPWLLATGALWAAGKLNPLPAIGLVTLAAVLADSLWFYIGRRGGQRVLRLFCRLSLSRNSCVGRCQHVMERHGLQTLVAAKFLPGLGTVMPPLAGAMGMSAGRFLLFDSVGSLTYGASYIVAGFVFHNQLEQAIAVLKHLGFNALVLALALVTGFIGLKYARRRKVPRPGTHDSKTANGTAGSGMSALELPSFTPALTGPVSQSMETPAAAHKPQTRKLTT